MTLKELLAERAGFDVSTPHGAEKLQKDILADTGEQLSVNTVKRLVGVISYEGLPRLSTLEIISRYLRMPDLKTLLAVLHGHSSDFNIPDNFIAAFDLPEGQRILLEWVPERKVILRHTAGGEFIVEESVNSKLKNGDTVTLGYVAQGSPLLIRNVVRGGESLGEYSAATETGLTKAALL